MNSSSLFSFLLPTEMAISQDMFFHISIYLFFISSLLISCAVVLDGNRYLENDETSGMGSPSTFIVLSGVSFCIGLFFIVAGCIAG